MSKANGSGTENVNYTYDAAGHRIAKEHETTGSIDGDSYRYAFTAKYTYLGDTLTDMQWVEVDGSVSSFHFTYDATGPMSMTFYGTEYFYLKNAQGDVTGLVDSSGTQVVAYTYDAWGNILSTTGSMADGLGYTNPFRYRGYFYDTETGLYYLQSRYYNPQWGRFVNADSKLALTAGVIGCNLFAYCNNTPVVRIDSDGNFGLGTIIGAGIGGLLGGISGAIVAACKGKSVLAGFVTGAVTGATIGGVCGAVADAISTGGLSVLAGAAIAASVCGTVSAVGNIANQAWNYSIEKKLTDQGGNPQKGNNNIPKSSNGKIASECSSFAEYIDVKSAATSGITAAIFAPLGVGANCIVNNAFAGIEACGIDLAGIVVANFYMGGNISILQSIIDLF